ncbi:Transglutaminase-like superfamily protein [Paenibacillus algorifonticola]|uniref:Transglutaminase-like superfamily protein n=1 Tax=Paenibacillus algorifonticola TaxID=684063 RepID=A0A1I2CIZ4_9BACL|nr:transglutaminase family protein [Paenibacillus algorifonticola]SFE68286.1 Transglutaminase-like superfamily protein [Paenibacillus algorifonticola]
MTFTCESSNLDDYLEETTEVDSGHFTIKDLAAELYSQSLNEMDYVKTTFEFVRDHISHSWDIQSSRITCRASEVLFFKEGICYAKSNLLCALLRCQGIPAGFCYQRLTLGDTPDTGHVIHALNAVYLNSIGKWIRLDARGNKSGVDAQFSLEEEKLAFPIREVYDESDYPVIYTKPNIKTINSLLQNTDCTTMYLHGLPSSL